MECVPRTAKSWERLRFLSLWRACEARVGPFKSWKGLRSSCHHSEGPVNLIKACLSAGETREGSFNHCGVPVNSCRSVYVPGKIVKAVFITVQVL